MAAIGLLDLVEYDRWANQRWLDWLDANGRPTPETGVFTHLLAAQEGWVMRFGGVNPTQMPVIELGSEKLNELADKLATFASKDDMERMVHARRFTGEEMHAPLGDLMRHVLNHSTYHRGELRGLCRAKGCDDFPETDLVLFLRTRAPQS